MQSLPLLLLLAICFCACCHGGKILFWMPVGTKSVTITYVPVIKALAERGHHVTVVHPYPIKEKMPSGKVTEIISVDEGERFLFDMIGDVISKDAEPTVPPLKLIFDLNLKAVDQVFADPKFKKLLDDPTTKFDVVIPIFLVGHEAGYYLAHRFKASLAIHFTGQVSVSWLDHALGMPHNPAYLPLFLLNYDAANSNVLHRTMNTLATLFAEHVVRNWYIINGIEESLDKHIPREQRPGLVELEKNTSLVLHFGHPLIMDGNRPLAPNLIYIGMMNCREAQPLPEDLKKFMDGAKEGVIFVSFGSVVPANKMSEFKRKLFVNVFSKLKQKVLWKWETETMPDKPNNLKLSKWLPQQDILAHPNTKLFITHSGQSSTQETLCHKKPVVSLPIFGDQPANGQWSAKIGIGEVINYWEVTEESLLAAITKVLNDPGYTKKVKEMGTLMNDQIDKPLDRAVWWIEHLIRNPNLIDYMRSPVHDLYWFQYYLLDVAAIIMSAAFILFSAIYMMCRCLFCRRAKQPASAGASRTKKRQ